MHEILLRSEYEIGYDLVGRWTFSQIDCVELVLANVSETKSVC